MIKISNLTKKYGSKIVVNEISLQVQPGMVTGFLGPNGAGKTTTMRLILGLAAPTAGSVSVAGKAYGLLENPLGKIGALISSDTIDTRLTSHQHLAIMAAAAGIKQERVDELLSLVGLHEARNSKIRTFSLGMKQRLGIAGALLGDPETIMMDEPFNGLDVDGIHWLRALLRSLAEQGKAILVSSHLLSEVQEVADRIIILARGELISDMGMEEMLKESLRSYIRVQSSNTPLLKNTLEKEGAEITMTESGFLYVRKMTAQQIGEIAFVQGIRIYELANFQPSLEQMFSELVSGKTDYQASPRPKKQVRK